MPVCPFLLAALLVCLLAMGPAAPAAEVPVQGVTFYVSPDGDDAWTGSLPAPDLAGTDGPFATVVRARDAIRALGAEARNRGPITVLLRAGRYALAEPLVFEPPDSGTEQCPITYQAYPGEEPVITGGRVITAGKMVGGKWQATLPNVAEGRWLFRQLFVSGRRAQRARTPNEGFLYVDGEISLDPQAAFKYHGADIKPDWAQRGDVEVIALQAWAELRMPTIAVDPQTQAVTLGAQCMPSSREPDPRYWIENAPDALDSPGEWYLDRASGKLSYLPRPGEDPGRLEVIAPALTQLVRLDGDPAGGRFVSHLHFRGVTFAHADWSLPPAGYADMQAAFDIPAAFEANGARGVSVEGCSFRHLGGYAIAFAHGCQGNTIARNEITDTGAGGIKIGEPAVRQSEAEKTGGNRVVGNHIHDIGIVYPAGVGVWVGQSGGNVLSGNHIHDTFYSGFSVGWTWGYGETNARDNIIERNHVHDIGRGMLSDLGGIYTLGVQPGTIIRHNLFHDITCYEKGYGGWGIYLDEGSTNILVEHNVVYNTSTGGFHQHYGRENLVRRNIFAFSRSGQIIRTRMEPHLSFTFERNIVYWKEGSLLGSNWSDDQYRLDYNLYWNASGGPVEFAGMSLADWQARGQDVHSLIADPLFVDPDHYDFRLQPGSPAFSLGFGDTTESSLPSG